MDIGHGFRYCTTSSDWVGGLAGSNQNGATIEYSNAGNGEDISCCYSTGKVTAGDFWGGIIGEYNTSTGSVVTNNYFNNDDNAVCSKRNWIP
ncbi:MAG: hypothetical protein JW864_18000 [Spirochaetes bacterium]|nr:hypothetical protein [Spirochaetota bacterium]